MGGREPRGILEAALGRELGIGIQDGNGEGAGVGVDAGGQLVIAGSRRSAGQFRSGQLIDPSSGGFDGMRGADGEVPVPLDTEALLAKHWPSVRTAGGVVSAASIGGAQFPRRVWLPSEQATEARMLRECIRSYVSIVQRQWADLVPKSVMCLLVGESKRKVHAHLVQALYGGSTEAQRVWERQGRAVRQGPLF